MAPSSVEGRCPTVPEHGPVLILSSGRAYCPHRDHDGRPKTHPLGAAPPTSPFFTFDQIGGRR